MKGQLNFDFIGGFMIFLLAIIFVTSAIIISIPPHYHKLQENNLRMGAWMLSNKILYDETGGIDKDRDYVLEDIGIDFISCNYDNLKNTFKVDEARNFNIIIVKTAVLLPNGYSGTNKIGSIVLENGEVDFKIKKSVSDNYDKIDIGTSTDLSEGDIVTVGGQGYIVKKIDKKGDFAMLERDVIDCGAILFGEVSSASTTRYNTFQDSDGANVQNHLAKIKVIYW